MAVEHHSLLGDIECVRSWRARSIRLVVRPDGTLRLTYPLFTAKSRAIAFALSKMAWIEHTRQRLKERKSTISTITPSEVERLRREARKYIPPTIERLARDNGLTYSSLRISSAHTRWGSCSGKNGISISLFVMLLPEHLREFIILHELCHTRHHNHSAAFHAMLNTLVGGRERLLNKELKGYRIPRVIGD